MLHGTGSFFLGYYALLEFYAVVCSLAQYMSAMLHFIYTHIYIYIYVCMSIHTCTYHWHCVCTGSNSKDFSMCWTKKLSLTFAGLRGLVALVIWWNVFIWCV